MNGYETVQVSHWQLLVHTDEEFGDLPSPAGDSLVRLTGVSTLTIRTGRHSGPVRVRLAVRPPVPDELDGWEAASEATLLCPDGRMVVCGLMGDCPAAFSGIEVPKGLLRLRVHARNRRPDDHSGREPQGPPEEYEIYAWTVAEDTGVTTLRADGLQGPT